MASKKEYKEDKSGKLEFSVIDDLVGDAKGMTNRWAINQDKWNKLRMRTKKDKTHPFIGCSNLRMPTAESKIRKAKSALINVVYGIRPVVQVLPSPSGNEQTANKIEKFLDHIIMDVIGAKQKSVIAIDQELEKGFYLLKPFWNIEMTTRIEKYSIDDLSVEETLALYDPNIGEEEIVQMLIDYLEVDMSDRVAADNEEELRRVAKDIMSGKEEISCEIKDVIKDQPDFALVSPERCYVPSDSGFDPEECSLICHEMFMPLRQLKLNSKEKGWDQSAVSEIDACKEINYNDSSHLTDITKDMREGIDRLNNPSQLVRIWEVYLWYDINGDGVDEKCVVTCAPDFSKVLRTITLPFKSGKFPFVKLFYELTDDRWFSHRGIPEIIEDIIKEIDIQHMQKIDQQTIRNTPMFLYRAGMVNPNMVKFVPNQGIPVHGLNQLDDTFKVVNSNNPNVEFSYEREEQILKATADELIGDVDYTLQSQINRRQPRTLGEVNLQANSAQRVFSLDADLHTAQFTKLFNWIWELWCQYGSDEYEFSYFGKEGWEKIKLSREEIQGKYKITVRGNDQNTNPQVNIQKAQTVLQIVSNPMALQTGVVTPKELSEAIKYAYQTLDVEKPERFVVQDPKPQQHAPPPLIQQLNTKFEDLEEGEQAQVLKQVGIEPDISGRMLSKETELLDYAGTHSKNNGRVPIG